jgi:hypothetical protein
MSLLSRLFAQQEIAEQPYAAEVLCSNWVEPAPEQPVAPGRATVLEQLREVDALTFLTRIYASQGC